MMNIKKHIFVCTSCRINGVQKGFCHQKGAVDLVEMLNEEIRDRDLSDVMVTNTGCFGICEKGPVMVVYPEGVWYGNVTEDDIEEIIESYIENDEPVGRLMI
ncbi:2Fe-2S ferredoxin [Clostridium grantii]|uniref:(2Fe-2S) ferredoxin n=1 Tax=Clostridium grantii DSM 8605 TaxID=1121316 RepID=A0A1M5UX04_9CLOT|nr:2Fe-2S ferredoxin [Clostridium grantii]SHH67515.1 (2Fe-2S) ferredoxin [Clostridium grantii DSM 8605]